MFVRNLRLLFFCEWHTSGGCLRIVMSTPVDVTGSYPPIAPLTRTPLQPHIPLAPAGRPLTGTILYGVVDALANYHLIQDECTE